MCAFHNLKTQKLIYILGEENYHDACTHIRAEPYPHFSRDFTRHLLHGFLGDPQGHANVLLIQQTVAEDFLEQNHTTSPHIAHFSWEVLDTMINHPDFDPTRTAYHLHTLWTRLGKLKPGTELPDFYNALLRANIYTSTVEYFSNLRPKTNIL